MTSVWVQKKQTVSTHPGDREYFARFLKLQKIKLRLRKINDFFNLMSKVTESAPRYNFEPKFLLAI